MTEKTDKEVMQRAKEEERKILSLLQAAGINANKIELLNPVIENTAWMKIKLDDARETIKNSQIAITYNNGGGQRGVRENPLFKGYEALWKSYMAGIGRIFDSLPAEEAPAIVTDESRPQSVLSIIRAKHKELA